MGPLQLALLLAGGFATTALGGSAVWEASLPRSVSSPVQHQPIAVDAAGYAIVDEAAHGRISKRWLGYKGRNSGLWPDRTVRFCYETQEGRDKLHTRFKAATKLWHAAGLKKDKYKMVEVADPGASCTGHAERAAILVIEYNDEENPSEMWAHAGLPVVDGSDPTYVGPVAFLHDKWSPTTDAISMAHEIGHVWGLDHEQQYRGFWSQPYNHWGSEDQAANEAETVFGKNFKCENIMGYADRIAGIESQYPNEPTVRELVKRDLCRLRKVASDYNFGAHAILPFMSQSEYRSPHPNGQPLGTDDVDFQSIMLYDSYAFSSNGQPTLLDNDGLPHFKGEWPSEADVFGIKTLYNDAEVAGRSAPRLPNNPASEWRRKWHQRQLASWGCVDP